MIMERNNIIKLLKIKKPKANFKFIRSGIAYYETEEIEGKSFFFEIPVDDMGDADFFPEMEARFLIRWLKEGIKIKI